MENFNAYENCSRPEWIDGGAVSIESNLVVKVYLDALIVTHYIDKCR